MVKSQENFRKNIVEVLERIITEFYWKIQDNLGRVSVKIQAKKIEFKL